MPSCLPLPEPPAFSVRLSAGTSGRAAAFAETKNGGVVGRYRDIHIHIYTHIGSMHTYMAVYVHTYIYIYMWIYAYIRGHIYIYVYIYINGYAGTCRDT